MVFIKNRQIKIFCDFLSCTKVFITGDNLYLVPRCLSTKREEKAGENCFFQSKCWLLNMKKHVANFQVVILYIQAVVGLIIYFYGFFPFKYAPSIKIDRYNEASNASGPKHIDKLALIVIDALRYDFVKPNSEQIYMPFTLSSVLQNKSCLVKTKAEAPTVTLPRLKAITSGTSSTYFDVVLNVLSSDFKEDNFLSRAVAQGYKIVFYGDETWINLFPKTFIRSEGVKSFLRVEYTEIDNNVTRHIDKELKRNDWDILILHYLGLDHIGHYEGPNSPLVKSKLIEMDNILKTISENFKLQEQKERLKTMLLLTSDHGMKDSGSHGGVTPPEVTVPLVSIGNPCFNLPGWPEKDISSQVDIAPTISALLGIPIPANSKGKIIPALLNGMSIGTVLKVLELNRLQLEKFKSSSKKGLEENSPKKALNKWFLKNKKDEQEAEIIAKKYFNYLNEISEDNITSNSDFKLFYILFGVVAIWVSLFYLVWHMFAHSSRPQSIIHWFFIFGTIFHSLSLGASSFIEEEHQTWYFFWITFCILLLFNVLKENKLTFQKIKNFLIWFLLSVVHRVFRKLNQTGDKWAFLPDIKSYLISDEGQIWLCSIFLIGLFLIFCCAVSEKCSFFQLLTFGLSLIIISSLKTLSGNLQGKYLAFYSSTRGNIETLLFWICLGTFTIQTKLKKTPYYLVWLLIASLFLRPHNVILLPVEVFISKQIQKIFCKPQDIIWNNIAHIWLGNVFYFYQGNGNSLANIDIASGFVGTENYNPVYAFLMISAHTANGQILSFMLSPKTSIVYAVLRIIPLAVYCTTLFFQLHHLFIWSVFSPKLFYETFTTLVFLCLILINSLKNIDKCYE